MNRSEHSGGILSAGRCYYTLQPARCPMVSSDCALLSAGSRYYCAGTLFVAARSDSLEITMLTMLGSPRRCCDGLTRRETLKVGALSLLGGFFNLPSLLALEQNRSPSERPGKAKSIILLYLLGGAATQDMYDLKPNAPSGVRSEFKPIATNVPGIQVCEHLPRMARWMHKIALVRSLNHKAGCHNTLPSYSGYEAMLTDIVSTR